MSSSARIDELRRKFDENPRRYFAPLANEYRKAGDFDQAIFICQEYLPQQPGHMSGHIVLGQALFEAKRLPEARTVFETALTLDPENLIALRHLADLSRALGDVTAARGWYERVLQADPRNEEIAAIMSSMPAPGAPPPPPAVPVAPPVTSKPTPDVASAAASAPTVELSAAAVQEMMHARQVAKGAEQTRPKPTLDDAPTIELTLPTAPAPMEGLEPTNRTDAPDEPSGGLLDIPSGGLLDQPGEAPTADIPSGGMLDLEPTAVALPQDVPVPEPSTTALTLDDFALPSTEPAPATPAEPSGLLDLGAFEIGGDSASAPPPPAPEPVQHDVGAMDFDFEMPAAPTVDSLPTVVIEAVRAPTPPVDLISLDSPPPTGEINEPVVAFSDVATVEPAKMAGDVPTDVSDGGALEEAPAAPEVAPLGTDLGVIADVEMPAEKPDAERPAPAFVTETMAQLYLEQGHRAEAIDIYRQLVAARPGDAELRSRLDAIERSGSAPALQAAKAPVAPRNETRTEPAASVASFSRGGPSIRSVLRDLLGIDATTSHGNGGAIGNPAGELGSIDILFSAEAVGDELNALAMAFDGGYVAPTGTIDDVFAGNPQ